MRLSTVAVALAALMASTSLAMADPQAPPPAADDLRAAFRDPPLSARPMLWWHWMNGNITEDGIRKDLAWMRRIGISGIQNFDAALSSPQIVDKRILYMTPEWKAAFRSAVSIADAAGMSYGIAASPGWSETGGPWVKPEDGMKKLVWSVTDVAGGKAFAGRLSAPPHLRGPYQDIAIAADPAHPGSPPQDYYADIAVIAYPVVRYPDLPAPAVFVSGYAVDGTVLADGKAATRMAIPAGTGDLPTNVMLRYDRPQTVRSATVFLPGAAIPFEAAPYVPVIEARIAGTWQTIATVPIKAVPTTVSFAAVTADAFRIVFGPNPRAFHPVVSANAPGIDMHMSDVRSGNVSLATFSLSAEPVVDQFEMKAGLAIADDYYALSSHVPDLAGIDPKRVVDLTERLLPNGTLRWTPPPGRWRVLRLGTSLLGTTNHPAPPEATGLEVDKYDAGAVSRYITTYLGMYRDVVGAGMFGKRGLSTLVTDSIESGDANWTPKMLAQFRTLRGYDPVPFLPALTGAIVGSRVASDAFLFDYRQTLADLIASEHYGTITRIAHDAGLTVFSEALETGRPQIGNDLAMRSRADIPMAALWAYDPAQGPNPSYIGDMKGAASVAHFYGRDLVAAESMTSAWAPYAFAPSDLKRVIDLEFASGINTPVIHSSVHQPTDDKVPGLTLAVFGQTFNRHESWAEMARPWIDYVARNSLMLRQGRNVADVATFIGEEAPVTAQWEHRGMDDGPTRNAFDYVNRDQLLGEVTVDAGEIVSAGGARYQALYLSGSSAHMTVPVLRALKRLANAGATIIGHAPIDTPSHADPAEDFRALVAELWSGAPVTPVGRGRVIAAPNVEAGLAAAGVAPDFAYPNDRAGEPILFVHRRSAHNDLYFVDNRADQDRHVRAIFRVTGKRPELWHPETGTSEPLSYEVSGDHTTVPLELDAGEAAFVTFVEPAVTPRRDVPTAAWTTLATLDRPWTVTFQPGRGAPASIEMTHLAPLQSSADDGVRYFSGTMEYRSSFDLPHRAEPGAPLWLDLGTVGNLAEVTINGVGVGGAWHAPYRVDIGAAARAGRNVVGVKVANLWVNRLIGDARRKQASAAFSSAPPYLADAPLRVSGLVGPVRLLGKDTTRGE